MYIVYEICRLGGGGRAVCVCVSSIGAEFRLGRGWARAWVWERARVAYGIDSGARGFSGLGGAV